MDDFLHNLRSGKLRKTDRGHKPYDHSYKKRNNTDRRRREADAIIPVEHLISIKEILATIAETQKRTAKALEARSLAEEKKADAMNEIAKNLKILLDPNYNFEISGLKKIDAETSLENNVVEEEVETLLSTDIDSDSHNLGENKNRELFELVYEMRSKGESWEKISRYLTTKEIPTVSGRGVWRGQSVKRYYDRMINVS